MFQAAIYKAGRRTEGREEVGAAVDMPIAQTARRLRGRFAVRSALGDPEGRPIMFLVFDIYHTSDG